MRRVIGWEAGSVPTATVSFGTEDGGWWVRMRVAVLTGVRQRLVGLLASEPAEFGASGLSGVLLEPCAAIHTLGMGYRIGVARVAADGRVLVARREVAPGLFVRARGARFVFERPRSDGPWPRVGERLSVGVP